jgi:hypothetical protein
MNDQPFTAEQLAAIDRVFAANPSPAANPKSAIAQSVLNQLSGQARPRPDIITPGSTGKLENARPYTFAGRVSTGPMNIADLMKRQPTESPDAEGMGGPASLAMAKVFKPAANASPFSGAARLAKRGAAPKSEFDRMFPALVDETTGEVIHAMKPGAGGHRPLYDQAATIKGFNPTRAFLDPETFDVFPEAMLEEILAKKSGFR